jgi:hypothetical protein
LTLIKFGFNITDIEKLEKEFDIRFKNAIYSNIWKQEQLKALRLKLIIAEGVKWGKIGATWDKQHSNQNQYNNWFKSINTQIEELTDNKINQATAWNKLEVEIKRRKIKLKQKR